MTIREENRIEAERRKKERQREFRNLLAMFERKGRTYKESLVCIAERKGCSVSTVKAILYGYR